VEASRFAAMRCCVNCLEALDVTAASAQTGGGAVGSWRCVFEDPQRCWEVTSIRICPLRRD